MTRTDWLNAVNNVLNNFLPQRSTVVLTQLRNGGLYPTVVAPSFNQHGGNVNPSFALTMSAPAGTIYYTHDGSDPRLRGGAISPAARAYTGSITLIETVEVKARVLSGSTWSALNAATFTLIQTYTDLFITEIMYNPPATELFSGNQLEFIELKNVGPTELDLSGVQVDGVYSGRLSNSGERLTLSHAVGAPVFSVRYDNQVPWPTEAAGSGASLERFNPSAYGNDPINWRASPGKPSAGLPNGDNFPPQVNPGANQTFESSIFPATVSLSGAVSDDGLPNPPGAITVTWSQVSGPGAAWFDAPNNLATTASLPGVGTYVFRLTANDGTLQTGGDLIVTVSRTTLPATLVSQGTIWKYSDTGVDLPASWINPGYNDTGWPSGPAKLGYGDGDEATVISYGPDANNKYVSTFFRRSFQVSNAASYSNLKVGLRRDDGGIVYLNGTEIFRSNMPEGPITFSTFASSVVGGADETTFYEHPVDPSLLVNGANVLAVRIHQVNGPSSDLSFDLYLTGTAFPLNAAPTVNAGPDQTVAHTDLALLDGQVADDGLPIPPGLLTIAWTKVNGPGRVTFANASAARTTAAFNAAGNYILRLTANDGAQAASDDVVI